MGRPWSHCSAYHGSNPGIEKFGRRIAQGRIAAGLISATLANDLPGPGTSYLSQTLRFKAPVPPGDTIPATGEEKKIRTEQPIAVLSPFDVNQDTVIVAEGEATVLTPMKFIPPLIS